MASQGWDLGEMRTVSKLPKDVAYERSISHNPMNQRMPIRPINQRSFEGDCIYEIRDEIIPQKSTKTAQKQISVAKQSRGISLGQARKHEDERDMYTSAMAFQEQLLKKQKTVISNNYPSVASPSTNINSWDEREGELRYHCGVFVGPGSQALYPSDSRKAVQGEFGSALPKRKSKQNHDFQNPTITRASMNRDEYHNAPRSISTTSHQRWRSTEENVKSTAVVLAKTTMEKLAFFQFKPRLDPQNTTVNSSQLHKSSFDEALDNLPNEEMKEAPFLPPDRVNPGGAAILKDALHKVNVRTKLNNVDNHVRFQPSAAAGPVHVSKRAFRKDTSKSSLANTKHKLDLGLRYSAQGVTHVTEYSTRSGTLINSVEDTSNPCGPTPAETRSLDGTSIAEPQRGQFCLPARSPAEYQVSVKWERHCPRSLDIDHGVESGADKTLPTFNSDQFSGIDNVKPAASLSHHRHQEDAQFEGGVTSARRISAFTFKINDNVKLPHQKQANAANGTAERHSTEIRVELFDPDQIGAVLIEESRDMRGDDHFDQDLDDDDLLAIGSNTAVMQSPEASRSLQKKRGESVPRGPPSFLSAAEDSHAVDTPALSKTRTKDVIESLSSSDIPEDIDEFPMDQGDEQEMLKLSKLGSGIQERFLPPESVENVLHDMPNGEVYDSSPQYSPPNLQLPGSSTSKAMRNRRTDKNRSSRSPSFGADPLPAGEEEDWAFIRFNEYDKIDTSPDPFHHQKPAPIRLAKPMSLSQLARRSQADKSTVHKANHKTSDTSRSIIDDNHEYEPMIPFARPKFPNLVLDRSPVVGVSSQTFLRTCFRIGEMFKEGMGRAALGQEAVIEIFCRVTFSSREPGSTKQHFQLSDLWHDHPPCPSGLLANFKATGLAESESKVFLSENGKMARCLGRFKKNLDNRDWMLHIINIRETDWEEIRWTKAVVSHGQ